MHDAWIWQNAIIRKLKEYLGNKYEYKAVLRNMTVSIYINNDKIIKLCDRNTKNIYMYEKYININREKYPDINESLIKELLDISNVALENA